MGAVVDLTVPPSPPKRVRRRGNFLVTDFWREPAAEENEDYHLDIHSLFTLFNGLYFFGSLGAVTVSWSSRMTLCAGVCRFQGGSGGVAIRLSEPLLRYRTREDLIDTLLHEMIHAFLFVKTGSRAAMDRSGGHGEDFLFHMNRINRLANTSISVFHSFHDQVAYHRRHVWRCIGGCRSRPPFFGYLRRAMNRPPSPADRWWAEHQQSCGGVFVKVSEP